MRFASNGFWSPQVMSLAKRLEYSFGWLARLGRIRCPAVKAIDCVHAVNDTVQSLNVHSKDRAVA